MEETQSEQVPERPPQDQGSTQIDLQAKSDQQANMSNAIRSVVEAMKTKTVVIPKPITKFTDRDEALMSWVTCPNCKKELGGLEANGWCMDCNRDSAREIQKESLRQLAIINLLGELKLTELMTTDKVAQYAKQLEAHFNLGKYQVTPGTQVAYDLASGFNPLRDNIYLWGKCGAGKSYLAYCLAKRLFDRGYKGEILKSRQLVRRLRGRSGYEEEAEIQKLIALDFIVLDELGHDSDTAYAIGSLCEIVEGRIKAIICTSNYSLNDLALRIKDDRLSSRLNGKCTIFKLEPRESDGSDIDFRDKMKRAGKLMVV